MLMWVFCLIYPQSVLSTIIPVKIYQVYSFIYGPAGGKFSRHIF